MKSRATKALLKAIEGNTEELDKYLRHWFASDELRQLTFAADLLRKHASRAYREKNQW